jgi:uncharacterized RDD family membrane protein YckC
MNEVPHWKRVLRIIGIRVPHLEGYTLDFLEARGLRFTFHFGRATARDKAVALYIAELERAWR